MPTIKETEFKFGDYAKIEQKRYGAPNEFYRYLVIGTTVSNAWREVPCDGRNPDIKLHDTCEDVVIAICDGVGLATAKIEIFRASDVDYWFEPLTDTTAKLEALVAACEPIMEKLELRDKRDAETGSYLWNDAHIELHQVHWRKIQAAVKAAGGQ